MIFDKDLGEYRIRQETFSTGFSRFFVEKLVRNMFGKECWRNTYSDEYGLSDYFLDKSDAESWFNNLIYKPKSSIILTKKINKE